MKRIRRQSTDLRRFEVRLPTDLVDDVDNLADGSARSRSLVIEDVLRAGLDAIGATA